jgi:hypothetical protein
MKSKELLFELIHSLTKSEKRYFKIFATMHGDNNNYVELFDAIHRQKEYNEEDLKKQFKGRDFTRQFSVAKNYLLNLILKSLRNFHHKAKVSVEINDLLSEVELLYWKGLYKLANKRLMQAKKLAEKYDLTIYLIQINYWKGKLRGYVDSIKDDTNVIPEIKQLTNDIRDLMQLDLMVNELMDYTTITLRGNRDIVEKVDKILHHPLLSEKYEKNTKHFNILSKIYTIKGICYFLLDNYEAEFINKQKLIDLNEQNPHQIKEDPIQYTKSLNNMLLYYYFRDQGENVKELLNKLNSIDLKFPHAKHIVEKNKFSFNLMYNLATNNIEAIDKISADAELWYPELKEKMTRQDKMILEYNLVLIYYLKNNYKNALRWANSVMSYFDKTTKSFRHDLAISNLIILFLIYIDLGYLDIAERTILQAEDIAKYNKYDKVEKNTLSELKKLLNPNKSNEVKSYLQHVLTHHQKELTNIDKDIFTIYLKK